MRFGTKWLDLEAQALRDDEGNEHPLTASEFGLLKVFAANPKRVLSRERLLELANARDSEAFDRAVDLRIMRIRRKIELDPTKPAVIRTIRGGGYLFSPVGDKALSRRTAHVPSPPSAKGMAPSALAASSDSHDVRLRPSVTSFATSGIRDTLRNDECVPKLRSRSPPIFTFVEIIHIFTPNVSSRALRRNNSPAHETIFRFACRRPETLR